METEEVTNDFSDLTDEQLEAMARAEDGPLSNEAFLAQRKEEYEDLIFKVMTNHRCGRGKARRIIESHQRKQIKVLQKKAKRNRDNLPKITLSPEELSA